MPALVTANDSQSIRCSCREDGPDRALEFSLTKIKYYLGAAHVARHRHQEQTNSPANRLTRARWHRERGMRPRGWQENGEATMVLLGN